MSLTREDFIDDSKRIGCDVACIQAVASVESSGGGFNPDGSPKTLFEGHWFHRYTKGIYAASHPDLSYPKWTKQFYGKTWQAELDRLNRAISLDRHSALMSASWGMFQVMGFNFAICGYKSVEDFYEDMCKDENAQLGAFTSYVINSGLSDELQKLDWDGFAYRYNGPEYKKNRYAEKLSAAYSKFKG
jgi:hypothetical protein